MTLDAALRDMPPPISLVLFQAFLHCTENKYVEDTFHIHNYLITVCHQCLVLVNTLKNMCVIPPEYVGARVTDT